MMHLPQDVEQQIKERIKEIKDEEKQIIEDK